MTAACVAMLVTACFGDDGGAQGRLDLGAREDEGGCSFEGDGPTACPRQEALADHAGGPWTLLDVRSASVFLTHCGELAMGFAGQPGDGEVATLYFFDNGPSAYEVGDEPLSCVRDGVGPDEPPADQPPFAALSWRGSYQEDLHPTEEPALYGAGVIVVDDLLAGDGGRTTGSVDVVFPDGTRLLADFSAPLWALE